MEQPEAVPQSIGSIPEIIRNDGHLYEGDLVRYFQILFHHAQNVKHPYHNFRHVSHVLWLCYKACLFYRDVLTAREMRNLLIAALFHDFDHSGQFGNDDLNIERAIRSLRNYILQVDRPFLEKIAELIHATEYPYVVPLEKLTLCGKILCDADMSQALSVAWIQQVIFGLSAEWNKKPIEVLKIQKPFLMGLTFHTVWAHHQFPKREIEAKIKEARELFELLDEAA
ncbi:MAG: hypothetical protein Q8L52_03760 [bacterium]|nr:hypothetical protein [bacterium]